MISERARLISARCALKHARNRSEKKATENKRVTEIRGRVQWSCSRRLEAGEMIERQFHTRQSMKAN